MLPRGSASAGLSPALIGLDAPASEPPPPPGNLCAALFDDTGPDALPVAFFTDHYCPNCRSLAQTLEKQDGIAVTRHELPILGNASVTAARAALAAGRQDARGEFHDRMRRAAFSPTRAYLRDVAAGLDLDPERFLADMDGQEVGAALRSGAALAASLGFSAVPVAVVGRTVVVGDIPPRTLSRLVEAERRARPTCPIRR